MERLLVLETPIGPLTVAADDTAVTRIGFGDATAAGRIRSGSAVPAQTAPAICNRQTAPPLLRQAARELTEYFAGARRKFTFPLAPAGTPFQLRVWEELRAIPYGETRTYGQIAAAAGNPRAARAVGMANNRNPIVLAIPCHRVIGANGSLTGFAGGLDKKTFLLRLEQQSPLFRARDRK